MNSTKITDKTADFSQILGNIAKELEIPESYYEKAKGRYEAVGNWLGDEKSPLAKYSPKIYPQGSFLLGTAIRPIDDSDEYDIDLVCELDTTKNETSWDELKSMVGDRLKANETYDGMLDEEKKRCWTLSYSESETLKFHLDILPAIPDIEAMPNHIFLKDAIHITDNLIKSYMDSNPKGFAEWFKEQMRKDYEHRRKLLSEQMKCEIESVPEYKVKTPLQVVVQILKRHRDIMYKDKSEAEKESKPISIIITTLAARAYADIIDTIVDDDLYAIASKIIEKMPSYIRRDGEEWIIPNPINPVENFADKWKGTDRAEAFFGWISNVKTSLELAFKSPDRQNISESFSKMFGEGVTNRAIGLLNGNNGGSSSDDYEGLRLLAIKSKPYLKS